MFKVNNKNTKSSSGEQEPRTISKNNFFYGTSLAATSVYTAKNIENHENSQVYIT